LRLRLRAVSLIWMSLCGRRRGGRRRRSRPSASEPTPQLGGNGEGCSPVGLAQTSLSI
jgi:hypothetical protein